MANTWSFKWIIENDNKFSNSFAVPYFCLFRFLRNLLQTHMFDKISIHWINNHRNELEIWIRITPKFLKTNEKLFRLNSVENSNFSQNFLWKLFTGSIKNPINQKSIMILVLSLNFVHFLPLNEIWCNILLKKQKWSRCMGVVYTILNIRTKNLESQEKSIRI